MADSRLKDYLQLTKFTLSFTVVFSCVVCYLLAPRIIVFDWQSILLLFVAGLLVTGSANAINQAVEKDTDTLMKRTAARPVASGRMTPEHAYMFATVTGLLGVGMMYWFFNAASALLSAFSLFLYAFIYTPLKKKHSIAVLIGGIPGALPCLIGWVAGNDDFGAGGWILFGIQFLWQFPHFWAIAWVAHEDYQRAGFRLLPSGREPDRSTALQAVMYAVLMIPVGMLPRYFGGQTAEGFHAGLSGAVSFWIVLASNFFMVAQCIRLYRELNVRAARRVMFSSYIYLPVVLIALLADKVH